MDQWTPAREIRPRDRDRNSKAFGVCLEAVKRHVELNGGDPFWVLDIRYGLGGWAQKIQEIWPALRVVGLEADKDTFNESSRPDNVFSLLQETFPPKENLGKFSFLVADFNNLTLLKADPLMEALELVQPRFLIFTDVACSKMHLNFKSYGLEHGPGKEFWEKKLHLEKYFAEFHRRHLSDWALLYMARLHHYAATTAWVKIRKEK